MKIFVSTGSPTYAQKANSVLNAAGIKNKIVKRQTDAAYGCGYGVEIKDGDAQKITELLSDRGVRIVAVKREE